MLGAGAGLAQLAPARGSPHLTWREDTPASGARVVLCSDVMPRPRLIEPGNYYHLTRRALERRFLLRPGPLTNAIIDYCLAEAAQRFGMDLISWLVMSNHYHAIVYDRHGRLPEFLEHLHKFVARALNALLGRSDHLWSCGETTVVHLATPEAVLEKVVYILANPLAADLVDRAVDWPGSSSFPLLARKGCRRGRPNVHFRVNGVMPREVSLAAVAPAYLSKEEADGWAAKVQAAVLAREAELRAKRLASGKRILGRKNVLRTSPFDAPTKKRRAPSLMAPPQRGRGRPVVATRDGRARRERLAKLAAFYAAYESARLRFISGDRTAAFPPGTYRFRLLGARISEVPLAA